MAKSRTSRTQQIQFDRNIDLFLSDKKRRIPSDYQFFSFIENFDLQKFDVSYYTDFLERGDKNTSDTRGFFESFFFAQKQYFEDKFEDFLFDFFQIVCPDSLLNLTKNDFGRVLETYQEKFYNSSIGKDKFNQKAKFLWLSLGFAESDYYSSILTSKDYKIFDIEKVSILHNLCVFFSYKLVFVYFGSNSSKEEPNICTIGCINSENIIYVGLRLDNIKNKKTYVLFLSKPKSQEKIEKKNDDNDEESDFISVKEQIYNLHFAHCCILEVKKQSQGENLYKQIIGKFNPSSIEGDNLEIGITNKKYEASNLDFICPKLNSSNKSPTLFTITSSKKHKILDACYNNASIYIVAYYEYKDYTHFQIFEGNLGDQYLDDMYLCAEEIVEVRDSIFGKVSLLNGERIKYPVAIILYKNKEERYQLLFYRKPNSKFISMNREKNTISNNFYYPSTLQYYTQWVLYKKFRPDDVRSKANFDKIDFDGQNIIFHEDGKPIRYLNIDDYDSIKSDKIEGKYFEDILKDYTVPEKDSNKKENDDEDGITDILTITEDDNKIIGIESNNLLFLLKDRIENIYYHPARNNFVLKSAIKSAFYRYKENMPNILSEIDDEGYMPFGIINVKIDVGFKGNIDAIFNSNPLFPGIYFQYSSVKDEVKEDSKKKTFSKTGKRIVDDDDEDDDDRKQKKTTQNKPLKKLIKRNSEFTQPSSGNKKKKDKVDAKILFTFNVAFSNAGMMVGYDIHRTKCQLAAAYALSTYFTVYGPATKIMKFNPINEVYDNWTLKKADQMLSNLIATYGVLLEMRDENEFNVAMNTLSTTKNIRQDFDVFYEDFKKIWNWF